MTATRSLFDNLVEGGTYQIVAEEQRSGRVVWDAFRYERIGTELNPGYAVWDHKASRTTDPPPGSYKAAALDWLADLADVHGARADCVLILPDGNERIEPAVSD